MRRRGCKPGKGCLSRANSAREHCVYKWGGATTSPPLFLRLPPILSRTVFFKHMLRGLCLQVGGAALPPAAANSEMLLSICDLWTRTNAAIYSICSLWQRRNAAIHSICRLWQRRNAVINSISAFANAEMFQFAALAAEPRTKAEPHLCKGNMAERFATKTSAHV